MLCSGRAVIEVGNKVLLQIAVGVGIVGDRVESEFLRQASLDGAKGALAPSARLRRAGQDLADAQCAQDLIDWPLCSASGSAAPSSVVRKWLPRSMYNSQNRS